MLYVGAPLLCNLFPALKEFIIFHCFFHVGEQLEAMTAQQRDRFSVKTHTFVDAHVPTIKLRNINFLNKL